MSRSAARPVQSRRPGTLRRAMLRAATVVLLPIVAACYGYYPVTPPGPVGRDLQLTLTDSGAVAMAREIGPRAECVFGRLAAESPSAVVLAVSGVRQRDGAEAIWAGERIAFPRPLLANVAERRFSRGRTVLLGGGLAVALVAVRQALGGSGFGSLGSGKPGTTGSK